MGEVLVSDTRHPKTGAQAWRPCLISHVTDKKNENEEKKMRERRNKISAEDEKKMLILFGCLHVRVGVRFCLRKTMLLHKLSNFLLKHLVYAPKSKL